MLKIYQLFISNTKLLRTILISSIFIALYGFAPIYLLNISANEGFWGGYLFLFFLVLVSWSIILLIQHYFNNLQPAIQFIISYIFAFIFHSIVIFTISHFEQFPTNNLLYIFLTVFAINTIIIILANSVSIGQKKREAENKIQQLQLKNVEAKLLLLMQQFQPHFLFNALSTLKSLVNLNTAEAEKYIVQMSEFLRYSIDSHTNTIVTLEQELSFTLNYIKLQKVRFGEAISFNVNLDKNLYSYYLPVYGLQLLVENAIKHNLFSVHNPLNILICNSNNVIVVSNNKQQASITSGEGIGLSNLNERYRLITGKDIEVINFENEFKVYLDLIKP